MTPLIWIIDNEWSDYEIEHAVLYRSFPGCEIRHSAYCDENDLANFGASAEAIICQIDIGLSGPFIERLRKCRIISVYGTGYDNIDIRAARKKGIFVANVPDYCHEEVSDHVIAFIYHFNKKVASYAENISRGLWGIEATAAIPTRLKGSTLFILGFGKIGVRICQKAIALGMNVIAYDPYLPDTCFRDRGVMKVDWKEGFQNADFVSVAMRLTPETREMIGDDEFRMMKKHAVFINTSRGEIVKEPDLVNAVRSGLIAGAGLDVTNTEPPALGSDILKCPDILITPHVSYLSVQSIRELREKVCWNVVTALSGKSVANAIQP